LRLLSLLPSTSFDAPLKATLLEVSLDKYSGTSDSAEYEALSYVWGARIGSEAFACDGKIMLVTPNCQSALRHLRSGNSSRLRWVDAICIDQGEGDESVKERNLQVALMGKVYAKARRTIC
ncbi:hypothetical protein EK21DRAFT_55843, partial [Setomelanomma holmii]